MPLRTLQGFINSVFMLARVPLQCPYYTCISRRAKQVEVSFKPQTSGVIRNLVLVDEGEWKVKKHGTGGKRRVWRKLHLAVDANTHEIIAAELSLSNVTDVEVLPNLLKDRWNNRWRCLWHQGLLRSYSYKASSRTHSSTRRIAFWKRGYPRNLGVACQKLYGSNKHWKQRYGYHKCSLSETAMYWVKQLLGGKLSLRDYNAQVGETYAMIKALRFGMPEICRIG